MVRAPASRSRLKIVGSGVPGYVTPKVAIGDAKGRWGSCRPPRPATRAAKGDDGWGFRGFSRSVFIGSTIGTTGAKLALKFIHELSG